MKKDWPRAPAIRRAMSLRSHILYPAQKEGGGPIAPS